MSELIRQFEGTSLAIQTRGLVKRFGERVALGGLDLAVPEGAVYLLVGPNGMGKTTALRALLDLVGVNAGSATVLGHDVVADGATVRAAVGYVPELARLPYDWMTVGEFLNHHAAYYEEWDEAYARELVTALGVDTGVRCRALSKGFTRRVQIVSALSHRPPLLLMDEPADGLDPVSRDRFFRLLVQHLASAPTTMLISTHLVFETELLADHIGVMRDGQLCAQLDRDTLEQSLRRYIVSGIDDGAADRIVSAGDGVGNGADRAGVTVVSRRGAEQEAEWVVWGDEQRVTGAFERAGGTVRSVRPVPLVDAARALMTLRGVAQ